MVEKTGNVCACEVNVGGVLELTRIIIFFKWRSFMNGGYTIHARCLDPNLNRFVELTNKRYHLEARKIPLEMRFKIKWTMGNKEETEERVAYLTDLDAKILPGNQQAGYFELIAIDPPRWYLNYGDASGRAFKGKISNVIQQVVGEYAPGIGVEITETEDSDDNTWWMMRQDPNTFLNGLMEWSAAVTPRKTQLVRASRDTKLIIKEQAELPTEDFGIYSINAAGDVADNTIEWQVLERNYLTNYQTAITTAGISAVSGLYCDNINTEDNVKVLDSNTGSKRNVNLQSDQSFSKPVDEEKGWTQVLAVPELSGGELGLKYQDWIDGRARGIYLNMLYSLLRLRVRVAGIPTLDDSSKLGSSFVTLIWNDHEGKPYAFNGKWLLYGFEHIFVSNDSWYTNLFLYRLDHDASAQKV